MSTTTGIEARNTPASAEGRGPVSIVEGGVAVEMGWGRLLLGASFADAERLAAALQDEAEGAHDIAFQLADPHVLFPNADCGCSVDGPAGEGEANVVLSSGDAEGESTTAAAVWISVILA